MTPIRFTCIATLPLSPSAVADRILELARWPDFQGYGPLPGIRMARFLERTPQVVGTRIAVTNTDGSTHTEEILAWEPERRLHLRLGEFSRPVSRLATHFDETWELRPVAKGCTVTRTFELHARAMFCWPALWLIARLLRRAINRHLNQLAASADDSKTA